MQVVEHEHQRLRGREHLEQLPNRAVGPVAVAALLGAVGARLQRREHSGEIRERLGLERADPALVESLEVFVERVDEHPERQVGLQLRRAAGEHDVAEGVGAVRQLGEQPRLPHAGLRAQLQGSKASPPEFGDHCVDHTEFSGTPDELVGRLGHRESGPA